MDIQPPTEPETRTASRSHHKKQEKKRLDLTIAEKLFTLTIEDDQGSIPASVKTRLRYGLAGALLVELALANKIQLDDGRLALADPAPLGNPLFDEILAMIAAEKKPRRLSHWVGAIGSKQTVKQMAGRLAERNVIVIEKKRYAWISPYIDYPLVNASAKYWVKLGLRGIVLAGENAEANDIALLSLLKACRLLRLVFTRDERKLAGKKVDALTQGGVFSETFASLLAEIESATAGAVAR